MHGLSRAVKHRLHQHLRNREKKTHGNPCNNVTMDDVEEVVHEVGGCVVPGVWVVPVVVWCVLRWGWVHADDPTNHPPHTPSTINTSTH